MVSTGAPSTCSTRVSAAPGMPRRIEAICSATGSSWSNSSPKTLTARSPRTPAMSSLKRIWMGCSIS
jgi:hypothetical protein